MQIKHGVSLFKKSYQIHDYKGMNNTLICETVRDTFCVAMTTYLCGK